MKIKKNVFLFLVMGMVYLVIELIVRAARMELVGWNGIKVYSLAGWTSLWMLPVGGLCGFLIGLLHETLNKRHMALTCTLGMLIIFSIELVTGLFFNVLLNMHIWDYSNMPLNILGQVTLCYVIPWFFLVPFTSWLDDSLRFYFYGEGYPSNLSQYYLNIFRSKQG